MFTVLLKMPPTSECILGPRSNSNIFSSRYRYASSAASETGWHVNCFGSAVGQGTVLAVHCVEANPAGSVDDNTADASIARNVMQTRVLRVNCTIDDGRYSVLVVTG